jgi:hypothetical protein
MKKKSSKTSKVQVKDLNPKKSDSVRGGATKKAVRAK